VHISGGVGIGGVLEPLQAEPVIVEDDCFIGARSEVAEGVIVRKGAVLAMGVFLGASTRSSTARPARPLSAKSPNTPWWCPGRFPPSRSKMASPAPQPPARSSSSAWTSAPAPRPVSTNCYGTDRNLKAPNAT
jgi:2,3,4,5-tetrahydropyridine-2-carboxylate N-succinyltransferase